MYANFIATASLIATLLAIPGFYEYIKGIGIKNITLRKLKEAPNIKFITLATIVAIIFYIVPFPEVHIGKITNKIVKVHDTIKLQVHDTVYLKGNKIYNNKMRDVNTITQ